MDNNQQIYNNYNSYDSYWQDYNKYLDFDLGLNEFEELEVNDTKINNEENNYNVSSTNYSSNNSEKEVSLNYKNKEKNWVNIIEESQNFMNNNTMNVKDKMIHKKLILKMKNRISAQRSRIRKKEELNLLQNKIKELNLINKNLTNKVDDLEKENLKLKNKLYSENSIKRKKSYNFNNIENFIVCSILIICIIANGNIIQLNNNNNFKVVKSGFIPLIKNIKPKIWAQNSNIKNICEEYCFSKFYKIKKFKNLPALENKSVKSYQNENTHKDYICIYNKNFLNHDNFTTINFKNNLSFHFLNN